MRRLGARLHRDRRGVAAVEMALVAPILAVVALLSFEVWQAAGRSADMRTALKAGAQYYMNGGADDADARTLALSAWRDPPAGGVINVSRACACGEAAQVCTALCADSTPPAALVTLHAQASMPQAMFNKTVAVDRVVRVR
jgi:Flp pilus assembly protein TadG